MKKESTKLETIEFTTEPRMIIKYFKEFLEGNQRIPARLPKLKKAFRKSCRDFNCWNFTSYLVGWADRFYWFNPGEMVENLRAYSKSIARNRANAGDIVVWGRGGRRSGGLGYLRHTGVIMKKLEDGFLVLHKDGSRPICIENLGRDCYTDYYGDAASFRRPLDNRSKNVL